MSGKLAAWLRVTPAPTTLAESSAIYQALSKQGRVSVFARCKDSGHRQIDDGRGSSSSTFYAVFPHGLPALQKTYQVPVYHDLPSAHDEDPFNIRGLQNRKPMPAPKTFSCVIEETQPNRGESEKDVIAKNSPYYGHFVVEKEGCVERVLAEMNTPPGLARGCGTRTKEAVVAGNIRKINMGSILDMWREASSSGKDNTSKKPSVSEHGSAGGYC